MPEGCWIKTILPHCVSNFPGNLINWNVRRSNVFYPWIYSILGCTLSLQLYKALNTSIIIVFLVQPGDTYNYLHISKHITVSLGISDSPAFHRCSIPPRRSLSVLLEVNWARGSCKIYFSVVFFYFVSSKLKVRMHLYLMSNECYTYRFLLIS